MTNIVLTLTDEQVETLLTLASDLRTYLEARLPRKPAIASLDDPWLDFLPVDGPPVASHDLMRSCLSLARPSAKDGQRLAACMRRLGWTGPRTINVNGRYVRGYQMKYLGDNKDVQDRLVEKAQKPQPGTSPELMKALSILLNK